MTESKATDKEREAFEAWAKTKKLRLDRSSMWPDRYSYCQTDDAWDGWRAALSSRDEATADAADAKRYRWLRDKSEPGICAFYMSVGQAFKDVRFTRATVDAAIDSQIDADQERTSTEGKVCGKCGQTDQGQTGEYACSECGLPTLWDEEPASNPEGKTP